jgi:hypothetical protein
LLRLWTPTILITIFFFFENQKKYFCKLKLFSQAE